MTSPLLNLPFEILCLIFIWSSNEELPLCCRQMYYRLNGCHANIKLNFLKQKYDNVTEEVSHYRFFDLDMLDRLEKEYGPLSFKNKKIPSRLFKEEPEATIKKRKELILELLKRGASADKPQGYPIIKSAQLGDLDQVKLLIKYGADPSLRKNMALKVSAARNNKDMVHYFLDDLKVKPDSETLKVCVQKNLWDMVQLLIEYGAVPSMSTLDVIPF